MTKKEARETRKLWSKPIARSEVRVDPDNSGDPLHKLKSAGLRLIESSYEHANKIIEGVKT